MRYGNDINKTQGTNKMKTVNENKLNKLKENDETNPNFIFSTTHTELLVLLATGEISAEDYAKREMANRGFDKKGNWVGFAESKKIWGIK